MRERGIKVSNYIIGYLSSLALTFASFAVVFLYMNSRSTFLPQGVIIAIILILALSQFIIQLIFFLHLLSGKKEGWKIIIFLSTISVVIIIVTGSLWIMNNLNYRMNPTQIMQYTNDQSGL